MVQNFFIYLTCFQTFMNFLQSRSPILPCMVLVPRFFYALIAKYKSLRRPKVAANPWGYPHYYYNPRYSGFTNGREIMCDPKH